MTGLKQKAWLVAAVLLCAGFLLGVAADTGLAQSKHVLRFVSAFHRTAAEHYGFWRFAERVAERLGDRVEIRYLGGEEVVPYFDQYEMMGRGAFDIGHLPGNVAKNFVPVAETLHLSRITPWEERERGVYDILRREFAEKLNLVYLGKTAGRGYEYVLYTNFEVRDLDDFKGKTFRVAPIYVPFLTALGAGSVALPAGEVYTAMERGVVDGFGWPTLGPMDFGWYEVTKYRIDPGFYPTGLGVFINQTAWNRLPEDVRRELEAIMAEVEKEIYEEMAELVRKETEGILAHGMQIIELQGETAERYLQLAYETGWNEVISRDPELGSLLRDLTTPR